MGALTQMSLSKSSLKSKFLLAKKMKIAAQKFYKPDAAQRIAQNILSLIPRFMVSLAEPPK